MLITYANLVIIFKSAHESVYVHVDSQCEGPRTPCLTQ